VELELARGSRRATLAPSLVVLESKSEDGTSPADCALGDLGRQPTGLSKYRAGMELLVEGVAQPEVACLFSS
jgi:hypothetical protein